MRVSRFIVAFCAIGILAGKNKNKENKKDKKKKKQLKNSQQGMASDYQMQAKICIQTLEQNVSL